MKFVLAFVVMLCASSGWSAEQAAAAPATVLKGEVLEVKNVESYTYLRLKTADGEIWAAVGSTPVKKGAKVTIENVMVMSNFESKSLKRRFDKIVFGTLGGVGAGAGAAGAHGAVAATHPVAARAESAGDIKVARAVGPDARTVAEVIGKSAELKGKTVQVRGRVVKFSASIMGKNWLHLRDGSGSAIDNTNDVLVTTQDLARVGDVVLVKGTVRTDRDFGSGYAYKVLIEEATLQK